MDENPAIIATDLKGSDNHEIVVGGGEGITSLFIPGDIDAAFRENDWSIVEMVEVLTNIIRDGTTRHIERRDGTVIEEPIVTAREKMAAIHMLDKKAKEAMILGGLIQKDRLTAKKTTEDGTEVEYNAEGMRLTQEGSSRLKSTLALLEGASRSKSDEVIDVDPVEVSVPKERTNNASTTRNESGNLRGDGPGGGGSSLLPRQPRGSNSNSGQSRAGATDGPGRSGSGGDVVCGTVYGTERTGSVNALDNRSGAGTGLQQDDQGTVKGAKDERRPGIPVQSGRSNKSKSVGEQGNRDRAGHRPNPVAPKRPVVPGESGVKRTNWWEPGIPRRAPDSDAGSIRDCATAESELDRLKRIERAREQAAQAAAGYLERREKNQRTRRHAPGDSNEPRPGDGSDAASDSA